MVRSENIYAVVKARKTNKKGHLALSIPIELREDMAIKEGDSFVVKSDSLNPRRIVYERNEA